jgi:hypothetical protein
VSRHADLSDSYDADAHRHALVHGLREWHAFVTRCLNRIGPEGVRYAGTSAREAALRAECESMASEDSGNPFELWWMMALARVEMASSHLAATAAVLADEDSLGSVPALLRTWCEASARALWLLDPEVSAREAIERALTDWLAEADEVRKLKPSATAVTFPASVAAIVDPIAAATGLEPKSRRPTAVSLIEKYGAPGVGDRARDGVGSLYRRGSGVVHSGFGGWVTTLWARDPAFLEVGTLQSVVLDAPVALDLHARTLKAWTSLQEWAPADVFDRAWDDAFACAMVPVAELGAAAAKRRREPGW